MEKIGFSFAFLTICLTLSYSAEASKCLRGDQDVTKFAVSMGNCSGYYIKPNIVMTAAHCLSSGTKYVIHMGSSGGDGQIGRLLFKDDQRGIVLLKTDNNHPYLTQEDFNCIELKDNLNATPYSKKFLVGAAMSSFVFPIPIILMCVDPLQKGLQITCNTATNSGQSGSALIGFSTEMDRIYIFGVHTTGNGINIDGVTYYNSGTSKSVADVISFLNSHTSQGSAAEKRD